MKLVGEVPGVIILSLSRGDNRRPPSPESRAFLHVSGLTRWSTACLVSRLEWRGSQTARHAKYAFSPSGSP